MRIAAARELAKDRHNWPLLVASKNAAIRRIGLDIAPEEAREAALIDPHAGVRNDARYLLGKRDYAVLYRTLLPAPGAISGLGETGQREDAALLRPFLIESQPDLRRRALEADELLLAVQDSSGKVRRTAIQSLTQLSVSIDADEVIDWKLSRAEAWALMDRARRWSALLAVLRRPGEFPDGESWLLRWAKAARSKPVPPQPAEASDALVLVMESEGSLPVSTTKALRDAIGPWLRR